MMKKILSMLMIITFATSFSAFAEMTGREILEKQEELHESQTEVEFQKMILIDKSGKKDIREVRRYAKEVEADVYRGLIAFVEPADIRGTALLNWQHADQDDDQWLYLPAQGRLQRIAKGGKKNYFMGTDFTYEDLESEEYDDYVYTILREEELDGTLFWVIEAVPANDEVKKNSGYGKRIQWVSKTDYTTLKVEFYDRRAKLIKTQTNAEFENVGGTMMRPKKVLMDNHKIEHKTLIGAVSREVNGEIDDETFAERFILKGKHVQ